MNLIAIFPRQSLLRALAGAIGLFKAAKTRPSPRYVNIGEFSPHLQRDMGFIDGRSAPGAGGGRDEHDLETRDWMR